MQDKEGNKEKNNENNKIIKCQTFSESQAQDNLNDYDDNVNKSI